MLRSDLCDYSDAYIVVKDLLAAAANENHKAEKNVAFKNNAPFRSCISKISSTLIDNTKEYRIVSSHRIVKAFQDLLLKILQTLAYTSSNTWYRVKKIIPTGGV